jgi:hypothetical protein
MSDDSPYLVVKPRYGRSHAIAYGSENLGKTFCGIKWDGWTVGENVDCKKCLKKINSGK